MNREQKQEAVKEIGERLSASTAVFAVDYRGISVPQAAELRGRLREADASFTIVKNRLVKRITAETGTEELDEHLIGPTALAYVHGDPVLAAKAISEFGAQHGVLAYKGGIMEGSPLAPEQFSSIARLPGLDVLHGRLVAMTAAPLTGVVRGLNALLQGLASQLGQIADQGLVSGEAAPAEEATEEAEEAAEEEVAAEDAESEKAAPEEDEPDEAAAEEAPEQGAPEASAEEPPKTPAGGDDEAPTDEGGAEGEGVEEGEPRPGTGGEADVEAPPEDAGDSDTPGGDPDKSGAEAAAAETSDEAEQSDQGDDEASDAEETKED